MRLGLWDGAVGALLVGAALTLAACANPETGPWLVEGSTYRVGEPEQVAERDLTMEVFTDREQCVSDQAVAADEVDDCVPLVDRANGDVRMAFALRDRTNGDPRLLPLEPDDISISHDGRTGLQAAEIIPHSAKAASQLFIVLVDGSGSMFQGEQPIVDRVYRALLRRKVKRSFFPDDPNVVTGVVLLRFTNTVTGLDGRAPHVITDARAYETEVRRWLKTSPRGYTHLYDAVGYAAGPLLEEEEVKQWLALRSAEPTIIALTDGFNNEQGQDQCGDNAGRLAGLLDGLAALQSAQEIGRRPRVFTVGLGRPVWPQFDLASVSGQRPTPESLCGIWPGRVINGDLERVGIDNASLEWISAVGKGESYIAQDDGRLAQVFLDAAAVRHEWYEARYRVDPWFHRRSFKMGIKLRSMATAGATVEFHPSGWLDAPPPLRVPGTHWTAPQPLRVSLGLLMPILGGLVFLHFLGPASFNGRRAVTRRARRKTKAPAPSAGAEPPST